MSESIRAPRIHPEIAASHVQQPCRMRLCRVEVDRGDELAQVVDEAPV
jgi:hypothetical protein